MDQNGRPLMNRVLLPTRERKKRGERDSPSIHPSFLTTPPSPPLPSIRLWKEGVGGMKLSPFTSDVDVHEFDGNRSYWTFACKSRPDNVSYDNTDDIARTHSIGSRSSGSTFDHRSRVLDHPVLLRRSGCHWTARIGNRILSQLGVLNKWF